MSTTGDSGIESNDEVKICGTPNCGKPAKLRCPTCSKMLLPHVYFCSQDCFKSSWKVHKKLHVELGIDEIVSKLPKSNSDDKELVADPWDPVVSKLSEDELVKLICNGADVYEGGIVLSRGDSMLTLSTEFVSSIIVYMATTPTPDKVVKICDIDFSHNGAGTTPTGLLQMFHPDMYEQMTAKHCSLHAALQSSGVKDPKELDAYRLALIDMASDGYSAAKTIQTPLEDVFELPISVSAKKRKVKHIVVKIVKCPLYPEKMSAIRIVKV